MQEQRNKQAFRLAIKHYWQEILRNWKTSLPGFVLPAIGSIFVAYIPPLVIAEVVRRATSGEVAQFSDFTILLLLFGGAWLLGEIFWRIGIHFIIKAQTRGVERLYNNALEQLLQKDLGFFNDNFAGSLTKKTTGYSSRFIDVTDSMLFRIFPKIVPGIFALVVLTAYSPWLSLCLIAWLLISLAIIMPLIKKRRHIVTQREIASNIASGHVADVYGNIQAVRTSSREKFELSRHSRYVKDFANKIKLSWDFQNLRVDTIISPLYVLANTTGLMLGLYLAVNGVLEFTAIIVVFSYFMLSTSVLFEFNDIYRRLESSFSDAGQFTELLLDEPIISDPKNPVRFPVVRGDIVFEKMSYAYPEQPDDPLFNKLNLHIKPGEKIGLVGHSGGGKTSLTKLILRLMDIDEGQILIDGTSISKVSQHDLRSKIAYVPQEPLMFHRSITENIRYGRLEASEEEIKIVAKMAHAHDFIANLPEGYDTLVGERGVKLSGGQRQRIAIARAMLKNAPILLLDEATSALDSESEKLIQDALRKLMQNKTAIVIAHRLSTIQKMDRILVLENGEIVEEGSHKELLKNDGIYKELWAHQSGGFIEE